jgi:hypothetical protein
MNAPVAHQRKLREMFARASDREPMRSLDGCAVETISAHVARPLILQYEWLGDMGRATMFAGLRSPAGELLGVACFGYGPAGGIRDKIGKPAWCLERGACVHWAPPNAASFLIAHACKLVYQTTKVERFFAYCDPMAGEYGAVYQAANWVYLGQGIDKKRIRPHRTYVLPPGGNPDNPAEWKTTRALRRGQRLNYREAEALGWKIAYAKDKAREAKHVYAFNVGPKARAWRKAFPVIPYPKPRPELSYADHRHSAP